MCNYFSWVSSTHEIFLLLNISQIMVCVILTLCWASGDWHWPHKIWSKLRRGVISRSGFHHQSVHHWIKISNNITITTYLMYNITHAHYGIFRMLTWKIWAIVQATAICSILCWLYRKLYSRRIDSTKSCLHHQNYTHTYA